MKQVIKDRINKISQGIVPEGYKKTKVGIIPEDWEVKKLGDLINKIIGGGTPSRKVADYYNGSIPWATVKDLTDENYKSRTIESISEEGLKKSSANIVDAGNFIVSTRMGLGRGFINKVDMAINQDLKGLYPNRNKLDVVYLMYWYKSQKKRIESLGSGSTVKGIDLKTLKSLKIYFLELKEQQKIASILSIWDRAIELKESLIKEKEKQKKGLMQILLTPNNSNQWQKTKLESLGSTYNGLSGKKKGDFGQGEKFITYKNVFDNSKIALDIYGKVEIKEGENQNRVKYGDIFFTTSSETPHEVGMSSVLLDEVEEDIYLNSFCFGYRLNNFEKVIPEFLRYYLRGSEFRNKISRLSQGSTRFNISKTSLLKLTIKIPPLPEQKRIAEILSTADREIDFLKEEVEQLKEQKKGLMQLLLTGIIRVKGDDDEKKL